MTSTPTLTSSRTLFRHQSEALRWLPENGGYLAFEQGLGKTLTAIRYADAEPRVLVICPAVAIGVWATELLTEGKDPLVPEGTRAQKAEWIKDLDYDEEDGWLILNYEAIIDKGMERAIERWDPDLIIVDEAQKIKNPTAKRSRAVHRLARSRPVLAMSGTPVTKNLLDLYSQYKAIDPAIWDRQTWTNFKAKYGVFGGYGGYELIGYQNVDELKDRIAPHTVIARKEDTLDLPEKTHVRVPVRLRGQDWSAYREMATTGVLGDWITSNPLERALRLSQLSGTGKLPRTVEFVRDLVEQGEQVVVFYRFTQEGGALRDTLGATPLDGRTSAAERTHLVDAFQAGDNPIFLAQIQAGSTAITLTAASYMVYHSLSYAYEDWAQSQDRIHRIGQPFPCTYYYMTSTGPQGGRIIDDLVLDTLNHKEDVAGLITRDPNLLLPEGA